MGFAAGPRLITVFGLVLCLRPFSRPAWTQARDSSTSSTPPCRIAATSYEGWRAEEISNYWVKLIVVPQLGGRLMQVTFAGHPFLFVNAKFKGRYIPPSDAAAKRRWINYGGDKIWPMPEGTQDEQHWPGPVSDALDDGEYALQIVSQDPTCTVRLEGPPDPKTGLMDRGLLAAARVTAMDRSS